MWSKRDSFIILTPMKEVVPSTIPIFSNLEPLDLIKMILCLKYCRRRFSLKTGRSESGTILPVFFIFKGRTYSCNGCPLVTFSHKCCGHRVILKQFWRKMFPCTNSPFFAMTALSPQNAQDLGEADAQGQHCI